VTDAVPSDAVPTVRATLARAGRTDRPKVAVPDDHRDRFPTAETVRLFLDGSQFHARVERALDGGEASAASRASSDEPSESDGAIELRSVRDNPRLARETEGTDRLREWADDTRLDFGRTVHLDVLDEGFCYGLRAPGETAVYDVPDRPDDGLASIAEDLAAGAGGDTGDGRAAEAADADATDATDASAAGEEVEER
jgi:hypothetical protein